MMMVMMLMICIDQSTFEINEWVFKTSDLSRGGVLPYVFLASAWWCAQHTV